MKPLVDHIRKARGRMAVQQSFHFCTVTLFFAVLGAILWVVLVRLFPVLGEPVPVLIGLGAVALVVGIVYSVAKRPSLADAAQEADRRAGLDERILSSYQLAGASGPMVDAVHEDAREKVSFVRLRQHFAYKVPVDLPKLAIAMLVFGVIYAFLPEFDLFHFREKEAQAAAAKQSAELKAKALTAVAKPLEKKKVDNPALAEQVKDIEKIAEDLRSQNLTEKQALAKIQKLSEKLLEEREKLTKQFKPPSMKQAKQLSNQAQGNELSKALAEGDYKKAAEKLREMAEKMKKGELSKEDAAKMAEQMQSLQKAMSGEQSKTMKPLAEALSKMAQDPSQSGLSSEQRKQLQQAALQMEDMASIMEQIDMTNAAIKEIAQWENMVMGPSPYCRMCGKKLTPCEHGEGCKGCGPGFSCFGACEDCMSGGAGAKRFAYGDTSMEGRGGLAGAGRGRGNEVGALPDKDVGFKPEILKGERTNGKVLASLFEKSLPDQSDEATMDYVEGVFMQAQQDAEQALTKEEIPPGAKELVRQYFSSIEPETTNGGNVEGE